MRALISTLLVSMTFTAAAYQHGGGAPPHPGDMFLQQFDANQDGKVSQEEFLQSPTEQFNHMDKNEDGFVTGQEATVFHGEMQQRKHQQMRQQRQGPPPSQMFLQRFDTNQDGEVTEEEFSKHSTEQFDQMDQDEDGKVTTQEVDVFHQEMMQRGHRRPR